MTASATLRVPAGWGQVSRFVCCDRQGWPGERDADFPVCAGAGEGIRTLDPNLGKVMLYP